MLNYPINLSEIGYKAYEPPKYSKWRMYIGPNFVIVPVEGDEPCWFHRKMQELCFGFKWERTE